MLILITDLLLPFALGVVRAYVSSPSTKQDGKLLDAVKSSAHYLACRDTTSLNFGQSSVLDNAVSFESEAR